MTNLVVLIGRLTKDPDIKKTSSGKSVASFALAVNQRFNRDKTDFINCVAWEKTAEFLGNYVKKGNLVAVEGRITTRNYDGSDGKKVYVTEVVCDSVQSLEKSERQEVREEPKDPWKTPTTPTEEDLPF